MGRAAVRGWTIFRRFEGVVKHAQHSAITAEPPGKA